MEIKLRLENLDIDSAHDPALNSDRNDHPEGVWMSLLYSLIDHAEELYLLASEIVGVLREVAWSQMRRFYWHAFDELVISYIQTAQRKAKKLQRHLEAIRAQMGPPSLVPANRRRLHKLHARTAISTDFS